MRKERTVFDDLGFSPEVAALLELKAELHARIMRCVKDRSQISLVEALGETQPRVSDLLRGKISKFSLDTLVQYAAALHMQPEIKTHKPVVQMASAR